MYEQEVMSQDPFIVRLTGPITDTSATQTIAQLLSLEKQYMEETKDFRKMVNALTEQFITLEDPGWLAVHTALVSITPDEPKITLLLNTPGGDVISALCLADTIKLIQAPLRIIAVGEVASAGNWVISAGVRGCRFALPNAIFYLHRPDIGIMANTDEFHVHNHYQRFLYERSLKVLAKQTGQSIKQLKTDCEKTRYFTPQQAIDYGIIDGILTG